MVKSATPRRFISEGDPHLGFSEADPWILWAQAHRSRATKVLWRGTVKGDGAVTVDSGHSERAEDGQFGIAKLVNMEVAEIYGLW